MGRFAPGGGRRDAGLGQQGKQNAADVGLEHAGFIGQVGDSPAGWTQRTWPPTAGSGQLSRAGGGAAGDDDRFDQRIGQDFFQVADHGRLYPPAGQGVHSGSRPE